MFLEHMRQDPRNLSQIGFAGDCFRLSSGCGRRSLTEQWIFLRNLCHLMGHPSFGEDSSCSRPASILWFPSYRLHFGLSWLESDTVRLSRAQLGTQLGLFEGSSRWFRSRLSACKALTAAGFEVVPGGGIEPSTHGFSGQSFPAIRCLPRLLSTRHEPHSLSACAPG